MRKRPKLKIDQRSFLFGRLLGVLIDHMLPNDAKKYIDQNDNTQYSITPVTMFNTIHQRVVQRLDDNDKVIMDKRIDDIMLKFKKSDFVDKPIDSNYVLMGVLDERKTFQKQ